MTISEQPVQTTLRPLIDKLDPRHHALVRYSRATFDKNTARGRYTGLRELQNRSFATTIRMTIPVISRVLSGIRFPDYGETCHLWELFSWSTCGFWPHPNVASAAKVRRAGPQGYRGACRVRTSHGAKRVVHARIRCGTNCIDPTWRRTLTPWCTPPSPSAAPANASERHRQTRHRSTRRRAGGSRAVTAAGDGRSTPAPSAWPRLTPASLA